MNHHNNWTQNQFIFLIILQKLLVKIVLRYPASYQGPKYSNHWPYTVAYTTDCVCSKMLNHGLNQRLFLSLFKLIPCPIHRIVYVLATNKKKQMPPLLLITLTHGIKKKNLRNFFYFFFIQALLCLRSF